MSCLFCNSLYHLSQNCDVYESDESREEIIQTKNCCKYCCSLLLGDENNHACSFYPNCFLCFRKYHPTFLCPNRFTGPNFFVPNIDEMLFGRFLQMLDPLEQYSFAFSSPTSSNLLSLKPVKVINYVDKGFKRIPSSYTLVIFDLKFHFHSATFSSQYNWSPLLSDELIIRARNVNLSNIKISAADLFKLISIHTKVFKCSYLECTSKIMFSQILQRAPFIEEIDLYETNVKIEEDTWIDHLMKFQKKFRRISLTIKKLNVDKLADFIKTRCCSDVVIILYITLKEAHETLQEKLLQHFLPNTNQTQFLTIYSKSVMQEITCIGNFILKKEIL